MFTNDLKKGDRVVLRNGRKATIADNRKGNIRPAEVYGIETETGSVYGHDIVIYMGGDAFDYTPVRITHPAAQEKARKLNGQLFGE